MLSIRTILHPTDFSDCSAIARQLAGSLARDSGARLVVVHVAPGEIVHPGLIGGRGEAKPHLEALEARLRDIFDQDFETPAEVHVGEGGDAPGRLPGLDRQGPGRGRRLGSAVDECFRRDPELFPANFAHGYPLSGVVLEKVLDLCQKRELS